MELLELVKNNTLTLKVRVNAGKTSIISFDPLVIGVKAAPEGGKANTELTKLLIRTLKKPVKLIIGATSRQKTFRIG